MVVIEPPTGMQPVWVSMGSNMGNRLGWLQAGLDALQQLPRTTVLAVSSVYETAFVGESPCGVQPNYFNCACELVTTLSAMVLLANLLQIEQTCGRNRTAGKRNEPRTLDIDIVCIGQQVIETPTLTVPHPRLQERLFVLTPLLELPSAATWQHPVLGCSVVALQQTVLATLPRGEDSQQELKLLSKQLKFA
jgi:2-amino-4-hydroxy-6-hydroxymethyldihydropteridine diphosphokinase